MIYAVAEPEVLRAVPAGGPPLKLDKRGCRPHSRLAPSPRPKASRGEADATAKAEGGSGESSIQRPFERPEPCDCFVLHRRPMSDGAVHACRSCDDPFASDCATDRSSPGASPLPCERACGAPLPAWSPGLPRGRSRPLMSGIRHPASSVFGPDILSYFGHTRARPPARRPLPSFVLSP
jgi:hypothetical protein